jgi:hypothetical protein
MRKADYVNKIFSDFFNNITPDRVPSSRMFTHYMIAEYAGINPVDMQADFSVLGEKAIELSKMVKSDAVPFFPVSWMDPRPAKFYQLLGSKTFQMAETGFVQHPNTTGMLESEYPELIKDPYAFAIEKVLPRLHKSFDYGKPFEMLRSVYMANLALKQDEDALMPAWMELFTSGEYYEGPPMGSFASTSAAADFIADIIRGFTGFSTDLKKHREELKQACDVLLPYLFYRGLPPAPHPEGQVLLPVHMPTYIQEKDFTEVWLPTFLKMAQNYAALGTRCWLGLGNDYTRYLDILQDFPAGTIMCFDRGDPKLIKDKLGDKHILTGMFPIDVIKLGTKQQVIDKVKEYLDILAPGGGYVFEFDRPPLMLTDINFENYITMSETVEKYGKYDTAGEPFGQKLNSEGYVFNESSVPKPTSKYMFNWDEFKKDNPYASERMRESLEGYDAQMQNLVFNLLI